MKNFLLLILLIISSLTFGSTSQPGFVPNVNLTQGVNIPLNQALIFNCHAPGTTTYCTLWRNGAAYQVPAGRTLVLVSVYISADGAFLVGYGDTAVSSTSAPTNNVAITISNTDNAAYQFVDGAKRLPSLLHLEIPATKYAYVKWNGAGAAYFVVIGYLR